jgi:hypothetical protein
MLGRDNSAFVLKGARRDIKAWTSRGLVYESVISGTERLIKALTRFTGLLVLLFIFLIILNGHTMDQLSFILLNVLGQVNLLLGQWLSGRICIADVELESERVVTTRTEVYAELIKEFKDINQHDDWIEDLGLLPKTKRWDTWKERYSRDINQDPKALFGQIPEGG